MSTSTAESLGPVVVKLDGTSRRIKWWTAFVMMAVPGLGTAVACWMLAAGRFAMRDFVLFGVMYFLHMCGITMGFHRYLAHKGFKTNRVVEAVLLVCGSMAGEGPILFWVATHRRHHLYSDREGDPHSPNLSGDDMWGRLKGLWYAHMPWMLSDENSRSTVFAPDILKNRRLYFYHRTYQLWVLLGLAVPALVGFAIGHTASAAFSAFIAGGLARMFVANQAAWCVGSVCHMFGGRPFDNRDRSANNWPVAILTFGEGLQNNHHAFPGSYRHGVTWWEPDLSGWLLTGLGKLGLVTDLRQPDAATIAARRRRAGAQPAEKAALSEGRA